MHNCVLLIFFDTIATNQWPANALRQLSYIFCFSVSSHVETLLLYCPICFFGYNFPEDQTKPRPIITIRVLYVICVLSFTYA